LSFESLDKFLEGDKLDKKDLEKQRFLSLTRRYKYGGRGRDWHPEFVKYMYEIVKHPNYKGIPWGIDKKGKIRWNAPSHRPPGACMHNAGLAMLMSSEAITLSLFHNALSLKLSSSTAQNIAG